MVPLLATTPSVDTPQNPLSARIREEIGRVHEISSASDREVFHAQIHSDLLQFSSSNTRVKNYIVRSINAEIAEISEVIEELTIAGKELLLPIYEAQWRYLAGLLSRMQKEVASAGVRKGVQVAILQESTRSQLEDLQAGCQIVRPGETFDPVWEAYTRLREGKKEGIFKPQTL